jgi:hypothetical protein
MQHLQYSRLVVHGGADHLDIIKTLSSSNDLYVDEMLFYVFRLIHLNDSKNKYDIVEADLFLLLLPQFEAKEVTDIYGSKLAIEKLQCVINLTMQHITFAADYYSQKLKNVLDTKFYQAELIRVTTFCDYLVITLKGLLI